MNPLQFSRNGTYVRSKDGTFVPTQNIAVNLGTTVNINDNAEGATDSTWSSSRLRGEMESIVEQMLKQTDELSQQIDTAKSWSIVIETDSGRNCYNNSYRATLTAKLYHGTEDVTNQVDDRYFRWRRETTDDDADLYWNSTHNTGTKTLTITREDLGDSSTEFICEFWDEEIKILSSKGE